MNIGVIGTGDIGAVIVKKLRDAGYPVTMPRRKKQSLNSLIGSASILLMPEQSLNRGGNNLDLPFTASIRRKKNFSNG